MEWFFEMVKYLSGCRSYEYDSDTRMGYVNLRDTSFGYWEAEVYSPSSFKKLSDENFQSDDDRIDAAEIIEGMDIDRGIVHIHRYHKGSVVIDYKNKDIYVDGTDTTGPPEIYAVMDGDACYLGLGS